MTPRTYASPEAFKAALEERLRSSVKTGAELARSGSSSSSIGSWPASSRCSAMRRR